MRIIVVFKRNRQQSGETFSPPITIKRFFTELNTFLCPSQVLSNHMSTIEITQKSRHLSPMTWKPRDDVYCRLKTIEHEQKLSFIRERNRYNAHANDEENTDTYTLDVQVVFVFPFFFSPRLTSATNLCRYNRRLRFVRVRTRSRTQMRWRLPSYWWAAKPQNNIRLKRPGGNRLNDLSL